jgi:hypothetical protein
MPENNYRDERKIKENFLEKYYESTKNLVHQYSFYTHDGNVQLRVITKTLNTIFKYIQQRDDIYQQFTKEGDLNPEIL